MRSLAKALELSMRAAAWLGPNTAMPDSARRSARPRASGISGPMTTRSTCSRRARATCSSMATSFTGTHSACRAMPELPGAAMRRVRSGLWASFQARRARGRRRPRGAPSLSRLRPVVGVVAARLHFLEVRSRDARPGAAEVELKIAPPVERGRLPFPGLAEHAGEVEVGVCVVGLHLESAAIPADGRGQIIEVLVERAQVEGGLAAGVVGVEGRAIAGLRTLVASHAVLEEAQVVPGRRVSGIDGDHPLVGLHRGLPALGLAVPRRGAGEPDLRGVGGRDERADETGEQRLARLPLEVGSVEVEQGLARARIETEPVLLYHDALVVYHEPELGERRLRLGGEPARAVEGLAHLAHRRTAFEEGGGDPRRHQLAETIAARVAPHESQALELSRPLGRQPQEPRQLPEGENPFRLRHATPPLSRPSQCLKCRIPHTTMARPCSSAAFTTSSSRSEPPGWITAVAPASATTSSPSRKGKKASEAQTVPLVSRPLALARITAMRAESTRFICPAPTPTT